MAISRVFFLSLLCALAPSSAFAGPWCLDDQLHVAPPPRTALPRNAEILVFFENARFAGKPFRRQPRLRARATLNGKPVHLSIRRRSAGTHSLFFVKVQSARSGELALTVKLECTPKAPSLESYDPVCWDRAEPKSVTYLVESSWKAPEQPAAVLRIEPYRRDRVIRRPLDYYLGLRVQVPLPALGFEVRWRRDADARWNSFFAPARPSQRSNETQRPSLRDAPPATAARAPALDDDTPMVDADLGETRCYEPDIPFAMLQAGIIAELSALLPDGSKVPVVGLPEPMMFPTGDLEAIADGL